MLVGGWPTPLKNHGVKVSWDGYSIPNMMGKSIQIPWFQSPPTSYTLPLLTIINHYQPLLTMITQDYPIY